MSAYTKPCLLLSLLRLLPLGHRGGFGGPHNGYELDAIGGYILVMMEAYETFGNQTYLEEAETAAQRFATDRGADEFFMSYEVRRCLASVLLSRRVA